MGYKYLLFDLDDTILDFKKSEYSAFNACMGHFGLECKTGYYELYHDINHQKWMQLNEGKITKPELLISRFEDFFEKTGLAVDAKEFDRQYQIMLGSFVYYIDGAVEILKDLSKKCKLYIITNGTRIVQKSRLAKCEFIDCISGVFISEEVGYEKPSTEFFDYVLDTIPGINKENSLIIGDSLTSDIRGGINSGIDTCWINPCEKEPNDKDMATYEVKSLKELYGIIK